MSNTVKSFSQLQYLVDNVLSYGAIPQVIEEVATTSAKVHQTMQVVGTTHELISYGDLGDDCLCVLKNTHATAIVSVGVEVAAAFYPLLNIPPGETSKLSRLEALLGTFIKSDTASTSVLVSLYEIL